MPLSCCRLDRKTRSTGQLLKEYVFLPFDDCLCGTTGFEIIHKGQA